MTPKPASPVLIVCRSVAEGRKACAGTLARFAAEGRPVRLLAAGRAADALIRRARPGVLALAVEPEPGRATLFIEVAPRSRGADARAALAGAFSGFAAAEAYRILRRVEP